MLLAGHGDDGFGPKFSDEKPIAESNEAEKLLTLLRDAS